MNSKYNFIHIPVGMTNAVWDKLKTRVQKTLDISGNANNLDNIKDSLDSGSLSLWMVSDEDGEYCGFAMTELVQEGVGGYWCHVAYALGEQGKADVVPLFLRHIERLAKSWGLIGVKLVSCRKAYYKYIAKPNGYEPRFVEYIKRI
jgi:hypothetical protein